jgi:hypothetical protein
MKKIEDKFVPYDLSLRVKDLGYDDMCFSYFINGVLQSSLNPKDYSYFKDMATINPNSLNYEYVLAPLWQDAFDWFREKHGFDLWWKPMSMVGFTMYYDIEIHHPKYVWDVPPKVTGKTYKEVRLECLKKLIEIVEQIKTQ